jgi:ribosomal protein L4
MVNQLLVHTNRDLLDLVWEGFHVERKKQRRCVTYGRGQAAPEMGRGIGAKQGREGGARVGSISRSVCN